MFDFGFGELLLLAVIALVVLGPERLPIAARLAGLWIRKARSQWNSVKSELENELADDELRRNLREASDAMREGSRQVQSLHNEMTSGARRVGRLAAPVAATQPDPDPIPPAPPAPPAPVIPETQAAQPREGDQGAAIRDPAQLSLLGPDHDLPPAASPADRS
jgi:sec-independent protein translocase protein TatB